MATLDDILYTARDLVHAAGRKVGDVAGLTKQKVKILDNEHTIRLAYEAVGKLVYDSRRSDAPLDEALVEELLSQVDELKKANEDLQAEIDHYCNRKVCACGATNSSDAVYCKACGKEL